MTGPDRGVTVPHVEPRELHPAVAAAFNARDVEALVALYEPDAWLFGLAGPVQGTDAVRAAWTELVAMGGTMTLDTIHALELGDLALLSSRWTLTAGETVVSAVSAEVARRQDDGTWRYVFDNPDAAGALAE